MQRFCPLNGRDVASISYTAVDKSVQLRLELVRPSKVDPVLAVGVSSSKPNNPRKKTKHTLKKNTQTKKGYLVILRVKNKFNGVF